jgi:hypothetical protein
MLSSFAVPAQSKTNALKCTQANAKYLSFRDANENGVTYAAEHPSLCVKVTGYIWRGTLYESKAKAINNTDPEPEIIGLWREEDGEMSNPILSPGKPRKAVIIGILGDCGTHNWPQYCHYVGGSIIKVADIKFSKRR